MRAPPPFICICDQLATRHQCQKGEHKGSWYYKCYKGFAPGCCKYFEWEQQPSPPTTPKMSPTRHEKRSEQNPVTPSRGMTRTLSLSPEKERNIRTGLKGLFEEDEFETAPPSPTLRAKRGKGRTLQHAQTMPAVFPSAEASTSRVNLPPRSFTQNTGHAIPNEMWKMLYENSQMKIETFSNEVASLRERIKLLDAENAMFRELLGQAQSRANDESNSSRTAIPGASTEISSPEETRSPVSVPNMFSDPGTPSSLSGKTMRLPF